MSSSMNEHTHSGVYCHCYPVFNCKPATAEVEGAENIWRPVCQRCQEIAFDADLRVRKLVPQAKYALRRLDAGGVMIDKLVSDRDFDPPLWTKTKSFGPFVSSYAAKTFMVRHQGHPS